MEKDKYNKETATEHRSSPNYRPPGVCRVCSKERENENRETERNKETEREREKGT